MLRQFELLKNRYETFLRENFRIPVLDPSGLITSEFNARFLFIGEKDCAPAPEEWKKNVV